jgi:hypothetical protein
MCLLSIFCFIRNIFSSVFNPRNTIQVGALRCELAAQMFKPWGWMVEVSNVPDRDIFDQIGLDAIALIRIVRIGLKISLIGCVNAMYVIPVYFYAKGSNDNAGVMDDLNKFSIANMNKNDNRMYATVVASYLVFGSAMLLIFQEFKWFISYHHKFLSQTRIQN